MMRRLLFRNVLCRGMATTRSSVGKHAVSQKNVQGVPAPHLCRCFNKTWRDKTEYRKITGDFVSTVDVNGKSYLKVEYDGLRLLSKTAIRDIQHLLRPAHLKQLQKILDDPNPLRTTSSWH